MTENLELFKQSFREEAREILVDLEATLLELNENPADSELVSQAFRGLHTIKGSGAMFGFETLAGFTHKLETAFDAVRTGQVAIKSELIDLTLAALDEIKAMLDESREEPAAARRRTTLLEQAERWTGGTPKQSSETRPRPATPPSEEVRVWHIRFRPGTEFLLNGSNPFLLIQELRALGGLSVRAQTEAIPPLAEMQTDCCSIAWELVLSTRASAEQIRDVFLFVEDSCDLEIVAEGDAGAHAGRTMETARTAPPPSSSGQEPAQGSIARRNEISSSVTSLRVPAAKLDQFVDLVGELVTVQARLTEIAARREDTEVTEVAEEIERLTASLRENSMNIRMVPIRATFEKFRRLVHDLARDLGKEVELTIDGADTELDKTVIEQLGDPLLHLIRNSMDHGIETPQLRMACGKQATAHIHLAARHAGASVLIEVSDDGGGIDAEAVRERAIAQGLIPPDATLSQSETFALLFQPGFSTAKQVSDVSGRGVGMDVVRKRIEGLRGTIDVASERGQGTTITLRLPLTLAIIDGLLVRVGDTSYVLPLANTLECLEHTVEAVDEANGKHVVVVRDEIVPYIRLRTYFRVPGRPPQREQIMVVETECGRFGFAVDEVLGDCQTVIKSLSRFCRDVHIVSGATILGNGSVALILDPERLAQEAVRAARGKAKVPCSGLKTASRELANRSTSPCSEGRPLRRPTDPHKPSSKSESAQ